jgi:hypothetical protein
MTSKLSRLVRAVLVGFMVLIMLSPQPAPAQAPSQPAQPITFFVTSVGMGDGGNLGGVVGADKHCQTLAAAVGAGDRTWRAYLSTHGEPAEEGASLRGGPRGAVRAASEGPQPAFARLRIGEGPWFNAKGQRIAQDIGELQGDTLDQARVGNNLTRLTALTEKGQEIPGNQHDILTGAKPDGGAFTLKDNLTCRNWTSSTEGKAQVGHADRTGGGNTSWNSAHASSGCGQSDLVSTGGAGLFYCFATK